MLRRRDHGGHAPRLRLRLLLLLLLLAALPRGTSAQCSGSSCSACVLVADCGWCEALGQCLSGGATGNDACPDTSRWYWSTCSSPSCAFYTRCDDCVRITPCGWCTTTPACFAGSSSGSSSCSSSGFWFWAVCPYETSTGVWIALGVIALVLVLAVIAFLVLRSRRQRRAAAAAAANAAANTTTSPTLPPPQYVYAYPMQPVNQPGYVQQVPPPPSYVAAPYGVPPSHVAPDGTPLS